jgi:hypothetical protein
MVLVVPEPGSALVLQESLLPHSLSWLLYTLPRSLLLLLLPGKLLHQPVMLL